MLLQGDMQCAQHRTALRRGTFKQRKPLVRRIADRSSNENQLDRERIMPSRRVGLLSAVVLLAVTGAAFGSGTTRGAVELSDGYQVPQNPSPPTVHLNAAQREQIRKALLTRHTEVEFRLKTTKSAKDFTPQIGAKLPKGVKPDGLPSGLIQQIPGLADYGYAKMKDEIILVNAMSGKIVDIIPEAQPETTGRP
jgi:hypothetical protein